MDGAFKFPAADDNAFSTAFADIYLENEVNLEQVDAVPLLDHDLSEINQQYPTNAPDLPQQNRSLKTPMQMKMMI